MFGNFYGLDLATRRSAARADAENSAASHLVAVADGQAVLARCVARANMEKLPYPIGLASQMPKLL